MHLKKTESIENDVNKVTIQVDFAENYTTQVQNAIQSSFWASKQFTLITACECEKDGSPLLSLHLIICYMTVLTFLIMLIDHLDIIRKFSNYVIFADSAEIYLEWNDSRGKADSNSLFKVLRHLYRKVVPSSLRPYPALTLTLQTNLSHHP